MAPKAIDLTGQVFGELTVMRRVPNVDDGYGRSKVAWLCRCSCGREVVYTTQVLRQRPYGKTSCGCKPPDPGPWAPAASGMPRKGGGSDAGCVARAAVGHRLTSPRMRSHQGR